MTRQEIMEQIEVIQDAIEKELYSGSNEHDLHLRESIVEFIISNFQQQLKEAKELLSEIDEFAAYPQYLRLKYNQFLNRKP